MRTEFNPQRRRITIAAALALLGYPVITVTGCGGSSYGGNPNGPNPTPTPTPSSGDVQGVISANHGHVATITAADLMAGGGLTLNIMGNASHNHTVALSGSEVVQIRDRTRVSKTSSTTEGHNHTVTFN